MSSQQRSETSPTAQILGFFATGSLMIGFVTWILLPISGAKEDWWEAVPTMSGILGSAIIESGWTMIATAVALLAASLVVLTISGLTGYQTIITLKRDALRKIVLAFIFTSTALLTLPAWGLLAGMLRVFLIKPPLSEGEQTVVTSYSLRSALGDGFNSLAIGGVALLVMWCAVVLAAAVNVWVAADDDAVGAQRISELIDQRNRQQSALRRLQQRFPRRYILQSSLSRVTGQVVSRLLIVSLFTWAFMATVAVFVPLETAADVGTTTFDKWSVSVLTLFIGPNVCVPILGWSMLLYVNMSSISRVVEGRRMNSPGFNLARCILVMFGIMLSAGFPALTLMSILPPSQYTLTLWIIGLLMPWLLIWLPFKWGRFDILLAKLARIDLAQQRNATRKELTRLQPASGPLSPVDPREGQQGILKEIECTVGVEDPDDVKRPSDGLGKVHFSREDVGEDEASKAESSIIWKVGQVKFEFSGRVYRMRRPSTRTQRKDLNG